MPLLKVKIGGGFGEIGESKQDTLKVKIYDDARNEEFCWNANKVSHENK